MKAIILLALVASANVFAATNSNDKVEIPTSNCINTNDNRLTNGNPSDAGKQLAMIEGGPTLAPRTTPRDSGTGR